VADHIDRALAEDGVANDVTSAVVLPAGATASAVIEQRTSGVLSGLDVAAEVFRRVDASLEVEALAPEGEWHEPGLVARVSGAAASILAAERTALNYLGRLSGVATLTARYVRAVEGTGVRILDTRKTTPGLRELEKAAVLHGGGQSHRAGLSEAVLVKENHALLAGGVGEAARGALAGAPEGMLVELEVETLGELREVLDLGVRRVLLDNMGPDELRRAVELTAGRAELEASGGVTLEVAETGVDFISVGALTHSAPALDLSLLLER
jgi:nicotinate-nucleotide pyrophosphorylase (carboxylating)